MPDVNGKKLVVTLDNRPIQNLSSMSVFISAADQDPTDVPIHLRFAPIDGQPPKLVQLRPSLLPERYRETALTDVGDGGLRKGYVVGVLNRGMDVRFDCLFEGMKLPEVSVETMMKGVVVERLPIPERTALQKLPFWDKVGVLILFIFGGFGMWWVQWRLFDWLTKRRRTFQRAKLPNALSDPANSTID